MNTAKVTTADFEEIRATTISAQEAPALFETIAEISGVAEEEEDVDYTDQEGAPVNAYGSPLALWELKSGHYKQTYNQGRTLWSRIKWGVCQQVIDDMGLQGRKAEGVYISTINNRMSSRVEMEVADLDENWEPMIAKNVASVTMNMWRNAVGEWVVPESVQIEAQHHMAVRGTQRCHVVGLFGGVTPRHFIVERDEDIVQDIIETIADFWELIETGRKPKANGARDQKILARLNSNIDPKEDVIDMRGNNAFQKLIAEKDRLKADEKAIKKKLEDIESELRAQMDGVGSAIVSDTHQIKWIRLAAKEVSYTSPPSAYLRVSKINPKAAGTPLETLSEKE